MNLTASNIPPDMRGPSQWVVWKYETRGDDKPTKVPFQTNGKYAKTTDPSTWASFGGVLEAEGFDGIGFVFTAGTGMCGIDLDNALENGVLKPWAEKIVKRLDTYTEISPSGLGVKMWLRGKYPGDDTGKRVNYRDGKVEMYHDRRFFTVTARPYPGTRATIREDQTAVDGMYRTILCPPEPPRSPVARPTTEAIDRCLKYIEKCPDAISGESGHDSTLRVACECFRFGLSDHDAWRVLEWYNGAKCKPAWTTRELTHKLEDARKKVDGAGEFGQRLRDLGPAYIPIAKPPTETTALKQLLSETIQGKRVNVGWPWPVLSAMARAILPETITVISGMGGSSKSLLVSEACLHWLETGVPFACFHLEENREYHQLRALAQLENNSNLTNDEWVREHGEETRAAYERNKVVLAGLGKCIWDAPASDVSLDDLIRWSEERAAEGARIIIIDPVTAADSGKDPWIADRRFVLQAKRIMRTHLASMIVVTHPRDGNPKNGNRMDNHAGGQAYNRFTQCLLSLEPCKDEEVSIIRNTAFGTDTEAAIVNRILTIQKTRNGPGARMKIGYSFHPKSLRFLERGPMR